MFFINFQLNQILNSEPFLIIIINITSIMKEIILIAFLCSFTLQQTVLLSSNTSNTIITSPANYVVALEAYHNANNPNYIGYGAKWLYKNGSSSWPAGDKVTFYSNFYADCQNKAILIITADNAFSVSLNGGAALAGNSWYTVYKFNITNLRCGLNTLVINTTNLHAGSQAALIFAVVQDQTKCYNCLTPLSFYNKKSCKCQCLNRCNCTTASPNYIWSDYPTCGCKCKQVLRCPANKYFNYDTCSCQCNPIGCLPGYYQNQNTCLCTKRCPNVLKCVGNRVWNDNTCRCECKVVARCLPLYYWNSALCDCVRIIIKAEANPQANP